MNTRSTHARIRRAVTAFALLVAALVAAGCGSLGGLPGRVEQPQVVTTREISRYPENSPVRTVLQWWRALQFKSPELAARYYSPRVGITPADVERDLKLGPGLLNLNAGLRVVDVDKQGRRGTVLVWLTQVLRHPNGRTDKIRTPAAFNVVNEQGRWLLADNRYVNRVKRAIKAFVEQGSTKKPKK